MFWRKLFKYAPFQAPRTPPRPLSFNDYVHRGNDPHTSTTISFPTAAKYVAGEDVYGRDVRKQPAGGETGARGQGGIGGGTGGGAPLAVYGSLSTVRLQSPRSKHRVPVRPLLHATAPYTTLPYPPRRVLHLGAARRGERSVGRGARYVHSLSNPIPI